MLHAVSVWRAPDVLCVPQRRPDASAQRRSSHRSTQACEVILRITSPVLPFQVSLQVAVCQTRSMETPRAAFEVTNNAGHAPKSGVQDPSVARTHGSEGLLRGRLADLRVRGVDHAISRKRASARREPSRGRFGSSRVTPFHMRVVEYHFGDV